MDKNRILFITPAIIAGGVSVLNTAPAAIDPDYSASPNTFYNEQNNEEWLNRIIIYYYSKLEENFNSLSTNNNLSVEEAAFLKRQTIQTRVGGMFQLIEKICTDYVSGLNTGELIFPLDIKDFNPDIHPITSFYGPRSNHSFGGSLFHRAIDIMAPGGSGVLSPLAGWIVFAERETESNIYTVIIYHGNGLYTRWAHINPVKTEGFVEAGQIFGRIMHHSRHSTGPHAHLEFIRRIGNNYYTVNINSSNLKHTFSFLKNGQFVDKLEKHRENSRIRLSYLQFLHQAKNIYLQNYNRYYVEYEKQPIPFLLNEMKKLVINENKMDIEIVNSLKNCLKDRIITNLRKQFPEVENIPSFINHFASQVLQIIDLRIDDRGSVLYRKKDFSGQYNAIISRFYPQLVYENFKTCFSSINRRIFSHIIEKITLKNSRLYNKILGDSFLKNIFQSEKLIHGILWGNYKKFANQFFKHIQKVFFLNLELPETINSFNDFRQYYQKLLKPSPENSQKLNSLNTKLSSLDLKVLLLKHNKNELFNSIVGHPDFGNLINSYETNFNGYIKEFFDRYVKSFHFKKVKLHEDIYPAPMLKDDKFIKRLLKGFPQGEVFKPLVKFKEFEDRILIFFESPGHFLGQKIFGVKLVVNMTENALLLIEQKKKGGKDYRIMARFKPKYVEEFGTEGFYFEIFKHETIVYLKSHSEHSHSRQYLKIDELKSLHLHITVHPVNIHKKNTNVIQTLLKPFEYSVPIALPIDSL